MLVEAHHTLQDLNSHTPVERYVAEYPREDKWQKVAERFFVPKTMDFGCLIYHTKISERSHPGFPDICVMEPVSGITVFAELKTETGKVTQSQYEWLMASQACGHWTFVWRPSEADELKDMAQRIIETRMHNGRK